jgi:hypothetical protein
LEFNVKCQAMRWLPRLLALASGLVFVATAVAHLDRTPPVYEDEPWQASVAYKLLTQGVFGSDLFAGFHNMDQRYYGFLPLHPLVEMLYFRVFGVGLWQARLETVTLGVIILALTWAIADRLFGAWVAALSVLMLVFVRWAGLTYVQLSGIPLVDLSRIARYDPLAAALGLLSLLIYVRAGRTARGMLVAGFIAGLSGLAHLYGLFWVPALAVLTAWSGNLRRATLPVMGALVPWLPYALYVLMDIPDWRGQTAGYANRFGLFDPGWYLDNILQEFHRYGPGLGPPGPAWLLRVGVWLTFLGVPIALLMLARRAYDPAARAIVVPGVLFPIFFALFIHLKLVNYTLLQIPIWAIALAWLLVAAWQRARIIVLVVVLAVTLEGAIQMYALEHQPATPYADFAQRVRAYVPSAAHVLGLHTYWFGFEDLDYRSFLVPLLLADEGLPLDQALDRMAPDTLLLDDRMRAYFGPTGDASAADRARFASWMRRHQATLVGSVQDQTYGLMEIYRLRPDERS